MQQIGLAAAALLGACVPDAPARISRFESCAPRGGESVCRARGCPGVDGYRCRLTGGWLALAADSGDGHWQMVRETVDVAGVVNAGGCGARNRGCAPGECRRPRLSEEDDCRRHTDSDFELHVTPRDGRLLAEANFWGGREHGPGDLTVEWEWMYFYPRHPSVQWRTASLSPGNAPGGIVPWRGDPIVVRGAHVLDCGEETTHGARAEIHPPVAMAWMHLDEELAFSATMYARAASHTTDPHPGRPFGPVFSATFPMPGATGREPIWIGPVQTDHALSGYLRVNDDECRLFDTRHPHAHVEGGRRRLRAEDLFRVRAAADPERGTVTVELSPLQDDARRNPDLVGLHFRVCVPDCSPRGEVRNACPLGCTRFASTGAGR